MRLLEELHHRSLRGIVRIGSVSRDAGADGVDAGVEHLEDEPEAARSPSATRAKRPSSSSRGSKV
jgi:hypothetical protein